LKIESITIHKKSATRRFQRQSGDWNIRHAIRKTEFWKIYYA
jgi:hypothetical protein